MTQQPKSGGHLVARNSVLSFLQMLIPIVLAVVTIPYVIHKLGVERFGILALVLVLQGGYASIFDIGMGRATTYFVAHSLGRGQRGEISRVAFTSLCVQIGASLVAAAVLALLTPYLADKLLHIAWSLQGEARLTFWLVSASLPLLAIYKNLRSVLEAHQRFDLITTVQIPSSSINRLLPAIGAWAGLHLPGIMVLLIISRLVTAGVYIVVCQKIVPDLWRMIGIDTRLLRQLISYGGWVTVCDFLMPVVTYADRLVIGSVMSVGALGYYAAPWEGISKVTCISSSIVQALFPALGTLRAAKSKQFASLYAQSMKYTLLLMTPPILITILFAGDILRLWIGGDFPARATLVLQLLGGGMLLWGLSDVSAALLDAVGRPEMRAKLLFAVGMPSVLLLFFFTKLWGVNGAAASWLITAGAQALAFFRASSHVLPEGLEGLRENGVGAAAALSAGSLTAAVAILVTFGANPIIKGVASVLLFAAFATATWRLVLDGEAKNYVFAALRWS